MRHRVTNTTAEIKSATERCRREENNESGQAVVEFILTFSLLSTVILFVYQMTNFFAVSNYLHYATFMSARAYLAAGPSVADQNSRATQVLQAMVSLPELKTYIQPQQVGNNGIEIKSATDATFRPRSWMDGVHYSFQGKLFLAPLGIVGQDALLNLTSESWLGREPSYQECTDQLKKRVPGEAVFDNGC